MLFIVLDFQKFVINSLTKIKYELTALNNTVQTSRISLDTFIENSHSLNSSECIKYNDQLNLDEYFSITNEENLNSFESKILNKDFKSNFVR